MSIAIEFRREGSAKDPIPVSLNLERQYVGEVRCLPPLQLLPSPDKPGTQECSTGRPETSKPNEASPSTSGTIPGVGRGGGTNSIQAEPTSKGPLREEWTQRQPYESSWFSFPSSGIASRYTVQTVITEARDANEFAAFWGRVLDASKKDVAAAISTEAGKALIPEQREAAEATRKTAQESARSSFATQLAMARQKLQACATAELGSIDLAQAALEASNEVLKANRLARAAGKPKPFSDPEIPEKASDKTRDACIRILQSSI